MFTIDINFLAVLTSGLLAFLLGLVWYHPKAMGKRWRELRGISEANARMASPMPFVASFFLWMLSACFFSFLAGFLNIDTAAGYFCLACLVWVAFAMPPSIMGALYNGSSFEAVGIDTSYHLGGYYIFAFVHMGFLYFNV